MRTATQGVWRLQEGEDIIILANDSGDYIEVTNYPEGLHWFYTGNIDTWRDLPQSVLDLISLWFTTKEPENE